MNSNTSSHSWFWGKVKLSLFQKILFMIVFCCLIVFAIYQENRDEQSRVFCESVNGEYHAGSSHNRLSPEYITPDRYRGCSLVAVDWIRHEAKIKDWLEATERTMPVKIRDAHQCQVSPYINPNDSACQTLLKAVGIN